MSKQFWNLTRLPYVVLMAISLLTTPMGIYGQEAAKNRVGKWREDIDYLKKYLPALDKTFSTTLIAENKSLNFYAVPPASVLDSFYHALELLESNLDHYTDNEIMVELSKLVSMSGNAHTRLYLFRNRTELRTLPVAMYWFEDGLYIIRSTTNWKSLVGKKVTAINTFPIALIKKQLDSLSSGSKGWKTYMSNYFINSPDVLEALGLSATAEHVTLAMVDANGKLSTVEIAPLPLIKSKTAVEAWWRLSPVYEDTLMPVTILNDRNRLPLYLQNGALPLSCRYNSKEQMIYLQINRTEETGALKWQGLTDSLKAMLTGSNVKKLVIDLRFNTGGNAATILPFLQQWSNMFAGKRCFLITSGTTFSAGIIIAAVMKHNLDLEIVGEEPGDGLQFWAEGGNIVLPNSKLTVHYANGYHDWTFRQTLSITPARIIPFNFHDYCRYKDSVMDYIEK